MREDEFVYEMEHEEGTSLVQCTEEMADWLIDKGIYYRGRVASPLFYDDICEMVFEHYWRKMSYSNEYDHLSNGEKIEKLENWLVEESNGLITF